jgi:hypothetical protein
MQTVSPQNQPAPARACRPTARTTPQPAGARQASRRRRGGRRRGSGFLRRPRCRRQRSEVPDARRQLVSHPRCGGSLLARRRAVGDILRLRLNRRDIWYEPHIGPSAESRNAFFLGLQLPNFFAKEVDVRQITHGNCSNELPLTTQFIEPQFKAAVCDFAHSAGKDRCDGQDYSVHAP